MSAQRSATCCDVAPGQAHVVFDVEGLCCVDEVRLIDRQLQRLDGVAHWRSDTIARRVHVTHDPGVIATESIVSAIAGAGMRARVPAKAGAAVTAEVPRPWPWAVMAAAACTVAGLAAAFTGLDRAAQWLSLTAVLIGGRGVAARAWASVRSAVLDIHVLMVVAVIGAVALGEFSEAASVVVLFAVAQALEQASMDRARRALASLVTMTPEQVSVLDGHTERLTPIDEVPVGARVVIRPGERVPLDGVVARGTSDLDESPVTGESTPVTRRVGDQVYAGSLNGTGAIDVVVSRGVRDSTVARIAALVERAQADRAPLQSFIDRFARVYTPAVMAVALLVAVVPPLVSGAPWPLWIYRGLVLLVIGCPCALVIATPVSFVSALAAAARRGLLVKGGMHLERLARVGVVAFDKTGTLTRGLLRVSDVVGLHGTPADEVRRLAAGVEARSEHPVARAIVADARAHAIIVPAVDDFQATPGRGAEGTVEGRHVRVGSLRDLDLDGVLDVQGRQHVTALEATGCGVAVVKRDRTPVGLVAVADQVRDEATSVVAMLRGAGVGWVAILTGDRRAVGEAVGREVRADAVHAELLPDGKVQAVSDLRREHGAVAMVGDGINDAPALAAADVGIAMGAAASPLAIETADMAVLGDDVSVVAYGVRLARATMRTIGINVAFALGIKVVFLALAIAGHTSMWLAILADTGASLIVVTHALRLLRIR